MYDGTDIHMYKQKTGFVLKDCWNKGVKINNVSTQTCAGTDTYTNSNTLKLVPLGQSSPSCAKLQMGLGCFSLEEFQRRGACEKNYSKNLRII